MVADNDLALGQIVESISKSKFWSESAIFVVEDDAQNGSDHVDAAANPMYASFGKSGDFKSFQHLPAQADMEAINTALAWGAAESEQLDFATEDAAGDLLLGDIVWRSVRGASSPMPPPVRAAFVFTSNTDDGR